jgi:hypothetical protein
MLLDLIYQKCRKGIAVAGCAAQKTGRFGQVVFTTVSDHGADHMSLVNPTQERRSDLCGP